MSPEFDRNRRDAGLLADVFREDFSAGGPWTWSAVAASRGLGSVLVACEVSGIAAWMIAPPAVSLQLDEPDALRKRWRVGRFDAADPEELIIALGKHVPGTYQDVTVDEVRSVVPGDLHDWITAVCDRQRTLADGFGRHDPRVAPNEEHVRAASQRFAEVAGTTESKRRANEEFEDARVEVPATVDEILEYAKRDIGFGLERVLRSADADADAARLRARASDEKELAGGGELSHLDRLIVKPWGEEFRVYDDCLTDVWLMHIKPERRTSLHAHERKHMALLCLDGTGLLSTRSGVQYALEPGVIMQIEAGVHHRATASSKTGLTLVEVDRPKDKFDLLRIEDDYRGCGGRGYEDVGDVELRLDPLEEMPNGPPMARLRPHSSTGPHRFGLERGVDLKVDVDGLMFAVSLDDITIAGPEALSSISPERIYLTIRATTLPVGDPEGALTPRETVSPAVASKDDGHWQPRCGAVMIPNGAAQIPGDARHHAARPMADLLTPRELKPRAVIITGPGFQDQDVVYTYYRLKEAFFDVDIATQTDHATGNGIHVSGRYGVPVPLDTTAGEPIAFDELATDGAVAKYDVVVLTGGYEAPDRIRQEPVVTGFVRAMNDAGKVVAGLGHGPRVMVSAGIMRNRRACAHVGMRDDMLKAGADVVNADVVVDDNMVTCSHYGEVGTFMKTVITLCQDRKHLMTPQHARAGLQPRALSNCFATAAIALRLAKTRSAKTRIIDITRRGAVPSGEDLRDP